MDDRISGTIKHLNRDKGFGFLRRDDGGDDLFFHRSGLRPGTAFTDLDEGDRLTAAVTEGRNGKGPRAEDVERG